MCLKVIAVVALEHRADEAWRAIAALRAEMLHHLLLHRVHVRRTTHAFDGDDFTTRHQADWNEATVDGAISRLAFGVAFDNRDRTCAAIAFRAALLGTGEPGVAKVFEQRRVGRDALDGNGAAIQNELKLSGHKPR